MAIHKSKRVCDSLFLQGTKFIVNAYEVDSLSDLIPLSQSINPAHQTMIASMGLRWFAHEDCKTTFTNAVYGSDKYLKPVEDMLAKVEATVDVETRAYLIDNAIVGFAPDVPSAIMGVPECMITLEPTQVDMAPITVWTNVTLSAGVKEEQAVLRGAIVAALILKLQMIRPVTLKIVVDTHNTAASIAINSRPFNLSQLSYVLCNPGFPRHCYWTLNEHTQTRVGWDPVTQAYGHSTMKADSVAKEMLYLLGGDLEHDIYIPGLHLRDEMLTKPVEWIESTLAKYRRV